MIEQPQVPPERVRAVALRFERGELLRRIGRTESLTRAQVVEALSHWEERDIPAVRAIVDRARQTRRSILPHEIVMARIKARRRR